MFLHCSIYVVYFRKAANQSQKTGLDRVTNINQSTDAICTHDSSVGKVSAFVRIVKYDKSNGNKNNPIKVLVKLNWCEYFLNSYLNFAKSALNKFQKFGNFFVALQF